MNLSVSSAPYYQVEKGCGSNYIISFFFTNQLENQNWFKRTADFSQYVLNHSVFISIVFQFTMTSWIPSNEETLKSHDSQVLIGGKRRRQRLYIFYEFIMCKFWFSSLISEISYLQLRTLDLSGNRIVSLPVELRFMTSVVNLNLGENPLTCTLANVRILSSWS